jgi:hypothetical protein
MVWQRAIQLSTAIYRFTADFPKEERFYGLTSSFDVLESRLLQTTEELSHEAGKMLRAIMSKLNS